MRRLLLKFESLVASNHKKWRAFLKPDPDPVEVVQKIFLVMLGRLFNLLLALVRATQSTVKNVL
jgi:hypothetical protein